jgi:chromosome segregation protein
VFLKNIEILGFKSFADRTRIEFSSGITALLGPNGCGKSNVVDAIKWVLGEHSARAMRATDMIDVIFNGTEARKPLNVAEVTLTIENEEGFLPIDRPEIQIKRRIYRSGESEYFINNEEARLKRVRELFLDTGVGKGAYSVMEQGKIDQALSSKPEERRYLFEEAAGISRYKAQGREAEQKLQRSEENIKQVEVSLHEIKRNYDTLKVQAEKTVQYRALKDQIFQSELDIQLLRLKQFKYDMDERGRTLEKRKADRGLVEKALNEAQAALEENMDIVQEMQIQFNDYQKKLIEMAGEKNGLEKEARLLNEQKEDSKSQIGQIENRERTIKTKIEELQDEMTDQAAVVADLKKSADGLDSNIASYEGNITLSSSRIGDNEKAIVAAQDRVHELEEQRGDCEKRLEMITDDIVAALDKGLREAGYSTQERRKAEAALEEALLRLGALLEGRAAAAGDFKDSVLRGTQPHHDALKSFSESLHAALLDGAAQNTAIKALFDEYRLSTPSFIDEFLAPEGIITKKRAIDGEIRANKDAVDDERDRIEGLRGDNQSLLRKIDEWRRTLQDLRESRVKMIEQIRSAEAVNARLERELIGQDALLKSLRDELYLQKKRFDDISERIEDAESEIAEVEKKGAELSASLQKLEKDIEKRSGDVSGKQDAIKKQQAAYAKVQDDIAKLDLAIGQADTEIRNIKDNFRENHSRDISEFDGRTFDIKEQPSEIREKLVNFRAALSKIGQVNLMAPEEFKETKERYEFQSAQLDDLAKARDALNKITAEIRTESSERFIAAYNKIKKNFHNMFRRLFGGGRAELRLSDPNHVLESGIEIYAQPPGKKLENIGLLSGGEKSMTAVALLFATYMVKPSPFCLLDEIDAALDESNVGRFVQILREFGRNSQFIVITHNKKTVIGAESLLGVTMEESGVSKLITVKLSNEESARVDAQKRDSALGTDSDGFVEEDVEAEEGRQLPPGIDDPTKVAASQMHPILAV